MTGISAVLSRAGAGFAAAFVGAEGLTGCKPIKVCFAERPLAGLCELGASAGSALGGAGARLAAEVDFVAVGSAIATAGVAGMLFG